MHKKLTCFFLFNALLCMVAPSAVSAEDLLAKRFLQLPRKVQFLPHHEASTIKRPRKGDIKRSTSAVFLPDVPLPMPAVQQDPFSDRKAPAPISMGQNLSRNGAGFLASGASFFRSAARNFAQAGKKVAEVRQHQWDRLGHSVSQAGLVGEGSPSKAAGGGTAQRQTSGREKQRDKNTSHTADPGGSASHASSEPIMLSL